MKRLLAAFAFAVAVAVVAAPAAALAETWSIDPDHTSAGFEATHLVITKVRGSFGSTTGTIELDDKDVTRSKIDVVIDATTINTASAKRDAHLKSEDFFWVEKYPQVTFKSTKVEKGAAKDQLKVTGDLSIRGVTKPVVLDVTYAGKEFKAPWGYVIRSASATTTINRKDFGMVWNNTFDGGGTVVGDNVKIMIETEFNHPVVAEAAPEAPKDGKDAKSGKTKTN